MARKKPTPARKKRVPNAKYAFEKGLGLVTTTVYPRIKKDLMEALKIGTRQTWSNFLHGTKVLRVPEAETIIAVFEKYGVPEPWGFKDEDITN